MYLSKYNFFAFHNWQIFGIYDRMSKNLITQFSSSIPNWKQFTRKDQHWWWVPLPIKHSIVSFRIKLQNFERKIEELVVSGLNNIFERVVLFFIKKRFNCWNYFAKNREKTSNLYDLSIFREINVNSLTITFSW